MSKGKTKLAFLAPHIITAATIDIEGDDLRNVCESQVVTVIENAADYFGIGE